jgi:hypothetical protein
MPAWQPCQWPGPAVMVTLNRPGGSEWHWHGSGACLAVPWRLPGVTTVTRLASGLLTRTTAAARRTPNSAAAAAAAVEGPRPGRTRAVTGRRGGRGPPGRHWHWHWHSGVESGYHWDSVSHGHTVLVGSPAECQSRCAGPGRRRGPGRPRRRDRQSPAGTPTASEHSTH